MNEISQQDVKEFLYYNPISGEFTWIKNAGKIKAGTKAGSFHRQTSYIIIGINKVKYRAHRLAWLYMKGEMPTEFIDHINNDRSDNRFCNLREASNAENIQNQTKPRSNNTTGYLGVSTYKKVGKYSAQIKIDGKKKHLGYFSNPKLAHDAYLIEKRKHHPFNTI